MTLPGNRKLVPTPGFQRVTSDAQLAGLELTDGQALPVSNADEARLRWNAATGKLEMSLSGAAYVAVAAGSIMLSPLGAAADDVPQILAALVTGKCVYLASGTWLLQTEIRFPSNSTLVCLPGCEFVSSLTSAPVQFPFYGVYTLSGVGDTTLTADTTIGSATITTHADVAPGTVIMVHADPAGGTVWRRQMYTVVAHAGAADPYTLTLDRPVMMAFKSGAEVAVVASLPQNIRIYANGARITGTGSRALNFTGTHHCEVHDLHVVDAGGFLHCGISWDEGCFDCHTYRCSVRGDGSATSMTSGGFTLESSQQCSHQSPIVDNVRGTGIMIPDSTNVWCSNAELTRCGGDGVSIYATDATLGARDVRIDGGIVSGCTNVGVRAQAVSAPVLRGLRVQSCANGIDLMTGCDAADVSDCTVSAMSAACVLVLGATRTQIQNITTRDSVEGINASSDFDLRGWRSDDNSGCALNVSGATPTIRISDFAITCATGASTTHIKAYNPCNLLLSDGSIDIAAAGHYCIRNTSTGTIRVRNVVLSAAGGGLSYYADSAASRLYDDGGCTWSAATYVKTASPTVWKNGDSTLWNISYASGGTVAQLNWGTFTANGATQVDVACAWIAGPTDTRKLSIGMGTLGGTPAGQPYESAARAAGHFYVKAAAGDTSVYTWRLAE